MITSIENGYSLFLTRGSANPCQGYQDTNLSQAETLSSAFRTHPLFVKSIVDLSEGS